MNAKIPKTIALYANIMRNGALLQALPILLLMLLCQAILSAQARFTGGLVAGVTASQIDGDASAGYNKLGLMAGARGGIRLKKQVESSIELLYVQRGAQDELVQSNPTNFSITLHYIEVPVQIHVKDWLTEDANNQPFYRVHFNGGLSYARLMRTSVRDDLSAVSAVAPDFLQQNDLSVTLGFTWFANSHLGFSFRWARSIIPIYQPAKWGQPPASSKWIPHNLYLSAVYVL
jgi:hypothetical protein